MPGPPRARGPMPRARCESPPSTPAGFIRPGPPTLGRPMQATARSRPGHRQGTAALLRLPAAAARGGGGRHAVRGQPSSPAHATRGKPGAQLLVSGTGPAAGPGGCEPRWVRHRNGLHKSGVVCGMSRARPSGRRGWAAPRALNRLRVRRLSPSLSSLSFSLSPSHSLSLSLSLSLAPSLSARPIPLSCGGGGGRRAATPLKRRGADPADWSPRQRSCRAAAQSATYVVLVGPCLSPAGALSL